MNPTLILQVISGINTLMALRDNPALGHLKSAVDDLIGKLNTSLPEKPDGSDWTVDDVMAAALAAKVPWQTVRDRAAPPTPE